MALSLWCVAINYICCCYFILVVAAMKFKLLFQFWSSYYIICPCIAGFILNYDLVVEFVLALVLHFRRGGRPLAPDSRILDDTKIENKIISNRHANKPTAVAPRGLLQAVIVPTPTYVLCCGFYTCVFILMNIIIIHQSNISGNLRMNWNPIWKIITN